MSARPDWLSKVQFNEQGLVPVIAQDHQSAQVLMLAWMNRQALEETARTGQAVYWSRSRKALWHKGEQSGHTQTVHSIRLDCDGDTILLSVTQHGGIACHTGRAHCFYQVLNEAQTEPRWYITEDPIKDPKSIYK